MATPYLTKSRYMTGLGCPRLLWLQLHTPAEYEDPVPGSPQATGIIVGEKARELYDGGVLVDHKPWEHDQAVSKTQTLMNDKSVPAIFEATFEFDNVRIRADILERLPRNRWAVYEVKASKEPKAEHIDDLAVQAHVLRNCGLKINRIGEIHLNGDYTRGASGLNWKRMFLMTDVSDEVEEIIADVPANISALQSVIKKRKEPDIPPGLQCTKECGFIDHCTAAKPEDWIKWLPRISEKKFDELSALGCESISDIPEDFPLTNNQTMIWSVLASNEDHVSPDLAKALRNYGPPTYYLDFEAMNPGIPLYEGTSPYQVIPFQWSLRKLDKNGNLKHWEFLAHGRDDPRRECAETLIRAVGKSRLPIQMYSTYESTTIGRLKAACPDLSKELDAIDNRLIDLKTLPSAYTYLRAYNFSLSIKNVAPALSPGFGYGDLEGVADGSSASETFERIVTGEFMDGENEATLRQGLLKYCERDTLAMVEVHRGLKDLVGASVQ